MLAIHAIGCVHIPNSHRKKTKAHKQMGSANNTRMPSERTHKANRKEREKANSEVGRAKEDRGRKTISNELKE